MHPILALCFLSWLWWQHAWRGRGRRLRGEERKGALDAHERWGNRIIWCAILLVLLGYGANIIRQSIDGKSLLRAMLPMHPHGAFGSMGVFLLAITWSKGRAVKKSKEKKEPFAHEMKRHGRAADLVLILAGLDAFIGLIYLISIL